MRDKCNRWRLNEFSEVEPLPQGGIGIAHADGTVTDFVFAWPASGDDPSWRVLEGAYDISDEESDDIYIDPQLLASLLGARDAGANVRAWYTGAFPDDELGPRISADLTFAGAAAAVGLGAGFYGALGVGDSTVRERVFDELADRYGIPYYIIYTSWLRSRPLPSLAPGELAPVVASFQMDNRFAVPSTLPDRTSALNLVLDLVTAKPGIAQLEAGLTFDLLEKMGDIDDRRDAPEPEPIAAFGAALGEPLEQPSTEEPGEEL